MNYQAAYTFLAFSLAVITFFSLIAIGESHKQSKWVWAIPAVLCTAFLVCGFKAALLS